MSLAALSTHATASGAASRMPIQLRDCHANGCFANGRFRASGAVMVEFNAWVYRGSDLLWASLIKELYDKAEEVHGKVRACPSKPPRECDTSTPSS